jgi:hypothetical protein
MGADIAPQLGSAAVAVDYITRIKSFLTPEELREFG